MAYAMMYPGHAANDQEEQTEHMSVLCLFFFVASNVFTFCYGKLDIALTHKADVLVERHSEWCVCFVVFVEGDVGGLRHVLLFPLYFNFMLGD